MLAIVLYLASAYCYCYEARQEGWLPYINYPYKEYAIPMVVVALSWILREILAEIFPLKKASLGVVLFWLIVPALVLVILVSLERGLQIAYFPLTFIPVLLSFTTEYFLVLPKQKANANPHDVA